LVLHGRDVFNDALATAFSRCFQIKRDLDPLPPEVAARLAKFNGFAENDIILWIAVGTEGPWKEGTVGCS